MDNDRKACVCMSSNLNLLIAYAAFAQGDVVVHESARGRTSFFSLLARL